MYLSSWLRVYHMSDSKFAFVAVAVYIDNVTTFIAPVRFAPFLTYNCPHLLNFSLFRLYYFPVVVALYRNLCPHLIWKSYACFAATIPTSPNMCFPYCFWLIMGKIWRNGRTVSPQLKLIFLESMFTTELYFT